MPKKAVVTHLHRYMRVRIGKKADYTVFKCTKFGCNHYLPKKLAEGKVCECNRCGEEMVLDARAMRLEKPHCLSCIERRKPEVTDLAEFIRNQMNTGS